MKLIVTLLLIITRLSFQKSHDELDRLEEKVDEITEKCMEKQKLHNLSDYFSSEETDLENLQCFIKCRQEAVGMISSEGKLNLEKIQIITNQFKICNDLEGQNNCDTAYKIYKCSKRVIEELNIVLKI